MTGWSYSLLSVRIRSRGGTAVFLDRAFGTSVAGPLNLLLWLSYFVMLGLYAVAFGAYLAALLGLAAGGPWQRVFASAVVVGFAALNLAGRAAGGPRRVGAGLFQARRAAGLLRWAGWRS